MQTRRLRTSIFIGVSLDGFIARPNGALDWMDHGGAVDHGYTTFMATVDALVMGRHTYETVCGFDHWPYGTRPVHVLSSAPLGPAPDGAVVHHLAGTPAAIVDELSARGFRHAYIDGGITIQRFLRAGLIQHLILNRLPVLIGQGIPLFGALDQDIPVRHVRTETFGDGLVQTEYEVPAIA
ncbi:MAG TPA: dihydrofolate reductase family protein [Gemmatimonadales bacterium]|nr:dihydrofolate reductase family protein [Gemmatimonadales bacterium]